MTSFARAIVIVLDSVGVGELPDAASYGDEGSNTLGNVARRVTLQIPALRAMGLDRIVALPGGPPEREPSAAYGRMAEASPGKDSVTGHWELMGLVLARPFPVFPGGFPADLIREFERRIGRPTLGNIARSGTRIIEELGREHLRTGAPIVYTSADSVFQIAAHEDIIPVAELYRQCAVAYDLVVAGLGVGRVIARPFVGTPGRFQRTTNRRDFALRPIAPTVLDRAKASGLAVVGIGLSPFDVHPGAHVAALVLWVTSLLSAAVLHFGALWASEECSPILAVLSVGLASAVCIYMIAAAAAGQRAAGVQKCVVLYALGWYVVFGVRMVLTTRLTPPNRGRQLRREAAEYLQRLHGERRGVKLP